MSATTKSHSSFLDYINVLKPRETSLLLFIGACAAVIATSTLNGDFPAVDFILTLVAIALGSAGANGLTNYLDRNVDARMQRTCRRVLPSRKIQPAEKALALSMVFIAAGLVLALILSPICFFIGIVGVVTSALWRKTISCTFFGMIAGSSPVLIGWYAITKQPVIDIIPALLFCLIVLWTPAHVWTLMIANRTDYENAGLHYFPLSLKDHTVIWMLSIISFALAIVAFLVYWLTGKFNLLYLVVSSILSLVMLYANIRLLFDPTSRNAWKVYKISAFPYLGIIFLVMAVDSWLM
ncbi:MAG: protoheme IX farnesyltransferase [Dehalococcoidia bacterium]|nr:protoheme IX farnesyltransferase [Dehalococcoidia bacterium]